MNKERIDVLVVKNGLLDSREKAKAVIMAGDVYANNQKIEKPGTMIDINSQIEIREPLKYVSRGGLKLEKALEVFKIDLKSKICLDIGASTGGFTDCMLKCGAKKVYAIDVGYGQLAWNLRNDSRVVTMERTNVRYVKPDDIGEMADFASVDVSFISLVKIFETLNSLLTDNCGIVCLIKPQFEAGREKVGKKGVVRDPNTHKEVLCNVINFAGTVGFKLKSLDYSPIKGPEGNIEYLAYFTKNQEQLLDIDNLIEKVVIDSHNNLN